MMIHVQISWELERTFCTSLPEHGKLNFNVHTKLHELVMDHSNEI